MKVALFLVAGFVTGSVIGALVTSSSTCCSLVAQGVRAKFPASLQTVGDAVNAWPALIWLANFGGSSS